MKTIKQIADEIGVSKTSVRKKIANLGVSDKLQTNGNLISIDEKVERLIKSSFTKNLPQTTNRKPVSEESETFRLVSDMVSILQEELKDKNEQITAQQRTISELTAAVENAIATVQAAQALHAGTMQQQLTAPEHAEPSEDVIDVATSVPDAVANEQSAELDIDARPSVPGHISFDLKHREAEKAWEEYLRPKIEKELGHGQKKSWQFWRN